MGSRFRLLVCALVAGAAVPAHAQQFPSASTLTEAQLAALCKKISFHRHPPGQMATTMREVAIERCVKNKGWLE
jgi:hypothetical protein